MHTSIASTQAWLQEILPSYIDTMTITPRQSWLCTTVGDSTGFLFASAQAPRSRPQTIVVPSFAFLGTSTNEIIGLTALLAVSVDADNDIHTQARLFCYGAPAPAGGFSIKIFDVSTQSP